MADRPLRVGQHVVVRDAFNHLRRATIVPVPRDHRDRTRSQVSTTRGAFPKCWVHLEDTRSVVPWPLDDVFDDLSAAEEAARRAETVIPTPESAWPWLPLCRTEEEYTALKIEAEAECVRLRHQHRIASCAEGLAAAERTMAERWNRERTPAGWYTKRAGAESHG